MSLQELEIPGQSTLDRDIFGASPTEFDATARLSDLPADIPSR